MTDRPLSMPTYPGEKQPSAGPITEEDTASIQAQPSRFGRFARTASWIFFTLFCLLFFTLLKLPQDRMKASIQGKLNEALAEKGITMMAGRTEIHYLFGLSYQMKDVTLNFPPPQEPTHIDEIELNPAILPLLLGKAGATVTIRNAGGLLTATGYVRGSRISARFNANHFDIGRIALLKLLAGIDLSGVISGHGNFTTSTDDFTQTDANIVADLRKVVLPAQSIEGFSIPQLNVSEGHVDFTIDHGKGQIKAFQLGNPTSNDDVKASISGDIMLGKTLQNSTCNLKTSFSLSPKLLGSFGGLLGSFLAPGKQSDGSFAYQLEGPLLAPNPIPVGAH